MPDLIETNAVDPHQVEYLLEWIDLLYILLHCAIFIRYT